MRPIEALADAIMQFEGWSPTRESFMGIFAGSRSWRNRNPGNLRPTNDVQLRDADGYRQFESLAEGWAALIQDLLAKFNGSHGLTLQSTLLDLLNIYAPAGDHNNPSAYTTFVCTRTTASLGRPIQPMTTLGEFLGNA